MGGFALSDTWSDKPLVDPFSGDSSRDLGEHLPIDRMGLLICRPEFANFQLV